LTWDRYASLSSSADTSVLANGVTTRIEFTTLASSLPLHAIIQEVSLKQLTLREKYTRLFIMTGRSRTSAAHGHSTEWKQLIEEHGRDCGDSSETRRVIGDVATAFITGGCRVGIVVAQARDVATEH